MTSLCAYLTAAKALLLKVMDFPSYGTAPSYPMRALPTTLLTASMRPQSSTHSRQSKTSMQAGTYAHEVCMDQDSPCTYAAHPSALRALYCVLCLCPAVAWML